MIQPTDVRIGNFLYGINSGANKKSIFQVKSIDENGINGVRFDHESKLTYATDVEGIVIDESFVIKYCGFNQYHQNPRLEGFYFNKQGYYPFNISATRDGRLFFDENTPLKYIHELQNLFRFKQGEELVVNFEDGEIWIELGDGKKVPI